MDLEDTDGELEAFDLDLVRVMDGVGDALFNDVLETCWTTSTDFRDELDDKRVTEGAGLLGSFSRL